MIRFNPNDPEIQGKKQYHVLNGFSTWGMTAGIFVVVTSLLLLYFIYQNGSQQMGMDGLTCVYYFFITGQLLLLGLYLSAVAFYLSGYIKPPRSVLKIFSSIKYVLLCSVVVNWLIFISSGYDTQFLTLSIILSVFPCLAAYALSAIDKLIKQKSINNFINNSTDKPQNIVIFENGEPSSYTGTSVVLKSLSKSIGPIELSRDTITMAEKTNDSPIVVLFKKWDPLYAYGKFLIFSGLSMTLLALISLSQNLRFINISYFAMQICLALAGGLVISACGYGLMRHKEWGRMLAIVLHGSILLVPLFLLLADFANNPMTIFIIVYFTVYFLPIIQWCYFVIRTLNSPVAKYVCLRGGYNID